MKIKVEKYIPYLVGTFNLVLLSILGYTSLLPINIEVGFVLTLLWMILTSVGSLVLLEGVRLFRINKEGKGNG